MAQFLELCMIAKLIYLTYFERQSRETPIHYAVKYGSIKTVQYLVKHLAEINVQDEVSHHYLLSLPLIHDE